MCSEMRHLLPVNVAFLCGAGTSCHMRLCDNDDYPVPMDSTFMFCAREIANWCTNDTVKEIGRQAFTSVIRNLTQHGVMENDLFPVGSSRPEVSMEEAFCRLEMLRMLGVDTSDGRWRHSVDSFRDLIAIVLSQGNLPSDNLQGGYHGLVRGLAANRMQRNAMILTLNYELGIEQAIATHFNDQPNMYPLAESMMSDGMISHNELYYYHFPNRNMPRSEAIPVMKLHGSCNWAYCPDCQNVQWSMEPDGSLDITRLLPNESHQERCYWHSVDEGLRPKYIAHVVAPTWNKWMGDYTLRHIWRGSHYALNRVRALFVIGTSLPTTDSHLRHLFHLTVSRDMRQIPPVVYVVNPVEEAGRIDYLDRLNNVLGLSITDDSDKCRWTGFEDPDTIAWIIDRASRHVVTDVTTTITY